MRRHTHVRGRACACMVAAWWLAFVAACATPRLGGASLAAPDDVPTGDDVVGKSCAVHVLGLPLALPRADHAVAHALDTANQRDAVEPSEEYNALLNAEFEEHLGVFTRCITVEGTPARVPAGQRP